MSGLSFIGSYSGIDRSTIDQLMEVERQPLKLYNTRKTTITEQQKAWKDINTRLNSLSEKIDALKSADTLTSMKATSTNEDKVSISASNKAVAGAYRINVTQLATNTSIIGNKVSGTLTEGKSFTIGGTEAELSAKFKEENDITGEMSEEQQVEHDQYLKDRTIIIGEGATLNDVAKEINSKSKETGVNASVIDGRMVLTNENTGAGKILLSDDGNGALSELGLGNITEDNYVDGELANVTGVQGAIGKNAIFDINGVPVESTSNSVSDIVDGLTINLKEVGATTVTVGTDYEKAEKAMQEFVDQYNSTMKFIEEKLAAGDPEVPGSAGTLSGDGTLMRLHSTLRGLVTSVVSKEDGTIKDISQLGVSTKDRYGELQFNAEKFRAALAEDPNKVTNFFSTTNADDEEIGYVANINKYIGSFISEKNGIIKGKNETLEKTLKDINNQIEIFEARMVKKEELYIKRFTALDVAMMQAESQMSWLTGQINAMNGVKN